MMRRTFRVPHGYSRRTLSLPTARCPPLLVIIIIEPFAVLFDVGKAEGPVDPFPGKFLRRLPCLVRSGVST